MKKFIFLSLICLFLPFLFTGCSKEKTTYSHYDISIEYNEEEHTADCKQTVTYVNNSNNAFEEIYFHLYPNAFREDSLNSLVSTANFDKAYPNGKSYGEINIQNVSCENKEIKFEISGEDSNILIVNLPETLYPNESVKIKIVYNLKLPNINHRFGYGENTVNFANFYPIACVYENGKGFVTDLYNSNGDPFYSDISNYEVSIRYNNKFILANTGNVEEDRDNGEIRVVYIKANKVRDFCFVLSEKFQIISEKVQDIKVNYYYYDDENPKLFLQTAVKAMKTFINEFGEYPYSQVSVVKSNFCYGGMEYPNIVLISDDLDKEEEYNYVIVHELAHQWWYGLVGNNQYENAWVDEGLTEYSTALFYEKNSEYGIKYNTIMENATSSYKYFVEVYNKVYPDFDTSMNRKINEFNTEPEYIYLTYTKGMLMFDALRDYLGKVKFEKCLRYYYNEFRYKNVSAEELVECFMKRSRVNLESFFKSWTSGKIVML